MTDKQPTADEMLDWLEATCRGGKHAEGVHVLPSGKWWAECGGGVGSGIEGDGDTPRAAIADAMRKEAARAE